MQRPRTCTTRLAGCLNQSRLCCCPCTSQGVVISLEQSVREKHRCILAKGSHICWPKCEISLIAKTRDIISENARYDRMYCPHICRRTSIYMNRICFSESSQHSPFDTDDPKEIATKQEQLLSVGRTRTIPNDAQDLRVISHKWQRLVDTSENQC
jgi:hypothetical protein